MFAAEAIAVTLWSWAMVAGGKEVPMGRWDTEALCVQHRQGMLSAHEMNSAGSHEGEMGFGPCQARRYLMHEDPSAHPVDRAAPPVQPPGR